MAQAKAAKSHDEVVIPFSAEFMRQFTAELKVYGIKPEEYLRAAAVAVMRRESSARYDLIQEIGEYRSINTIEVKEFGVHKGDPNPSLTRRTVEVQ